MEASRTLLTELDRCEFIPEYQYTGALSDYMYNGITYSESTVAYSQQLEKMYIDFLYEWGTLSELERDAVREVMRAIMSKRYIDDKFFFDVPTCGDIDAMINDSVPAKSIEMARFVFDMAEQQKFYLQKVGEFLNVDELKKVQPIPSVAVDDDAEGNFIPVCEKEWITYEELVRMYDFRGVKSAKDASWRKKNGFDKCVSQSGGKGSAVKYSVSKINEWLTNGKVSKK